MVRRRRWTPREDALIREAASSTMYYGIYGDGKHNRRLAEIAKQIGRSYAAVRMRASRINAYSYPRVAQTDIED